MKTRVSENQSPRHDPAECIVIGGSAGAIDALLAILPALPRSFPFPILVVVHLPPGERSLLAEIFAPRCQVSVKEAEDKEPIRGGTVYFAPPNYHLLVEPDFSLSLSSDDPVCYSRPAIDILFESAADAYGSGLRGIVLTGASNDGTAGLKAIYHAGGFGWVQNPEAAEVPLMPQSAFNACPSARVCDLRQLAHELNHLAAGGSSTSLSDITP